MSKAKNSSAICCTDIQIELAQHGLALQDAHPWNVLFGGPRPVYVDFGSIVPVQAGELWGAYDEFCRFLVYPLGLMSRGYGRIARWLLQDNWGVLESEFAALTGRRPLHRRAEEAAVRCLRRAYRHAPAPVRPWLRRGFSLARSLGVQVSSVVRSRTDFLEQVRRGVEETSLAFPRTEWSEYYDRSFPPFSASDQWTAKHASVGRVLSDLKPRSVPDVGSNQGWYSELAALRGARVVAFDSDEGCIVRLYRESKDKALPIVPLVMDFRYPSPGYGLCNRWFAPATDRLTCEMVLALALVHHFVFTQQLTFEQIVGGLSGFSNRWLLVEFVPREDRYVREWWSESFSWYNLDSFAGALEAAFDRVTASASHRQPRLLLLWGG